VAFLSPQGGYRTEKQLSRTTSKHIGKFFARHGYDLKGAAKIPQDDLERFVTVGSMTRRNPPRPSPDDAYGSPGKFEGERMLALEMYEAALESGADEEGGDSTDGPGYFWLFTDFVASDGTPRHGILEESGQGFITLTEYDTATDASEAWEEEVEPMLAEWGEEDRP
jgi:hypothetical protein